MKDIQRSFFCGSDTVPGAGSTMMGTQRDPTLKDLTV